jgi:hypoxanthine phosphoribosyltransferase
VSVPRGVLAARQRGELLFDSRQVVRAIDRLAVRLTVELAERNPLLICVLNGGLPFTGALMQRLQFPLELTYVHVSRYAESTTGGSLTWHAGPAIALHGRHILFVDDILDHGVTLARLKEWAEGCEAASVSAAVLLDKQLPERRGAAADHVALVCPDRYVFGWGMDYHGYWRNLPDIYAVPAELEDQR